MPIEITLPGPDHAIGPGYTVRLQSDFIGPLPTGSSFALTVSLDPEGAQQVDQVFVPTATTTAAFTLHEPGQGSIRFPNWTAQPGQSVRVLAQLLDSEGTQLDSTSIASTWQPTNMLWQQLQVKESTGGGLTTDQAAQLQRTDQATQEMDANWQQYVSVTLPSLQDVLNVITGGITATLGQGAQAAQHFIGELLSWASPDINTDFDMSGGTTCEPVRYDASFQNVQAVGVFIDQYPDTYRFVTPDGNWSFRDLAVLSFYRAGTILERHGIHSLVFSVGPLPGSISPWPVNITFGVQPGDYHIHVDWAPGVCGHVVGSALP